LTARFFGLDTSESGCHNKYRLSGHTL
jgi:hypothetical protein